MSHWDRTTTGTEHAKDPQNFERTLIIIFIVASLLMYTECIQGFQHQKLFIVQKPDVSAASVAAFIRKKTV